MRSSLLAAILLLFTFCLPSTILAQTATGEVNGTVTDVSGAAVPSATVKLTNRATQITMEATTGAIGQYFLIHVQPGAYTLRVEKSGFKAFIVDPLQIGVNQTVRQDASLAVGAETQTVHVIGEAVTVESSTTELGTVITQRPVNDLPLNGRNFTQLLTLTPGVTPVSTSQNRSIGGVEGNVGLPGSGFADPSFHGQQNRSKLYFFDGIINTNIRGPTYIVIPNIDSVQEFKVVGHDAKAEFGGATGGVMNMVSKSGGNSFHGTAFEYVRNNFFDARNSLTDASCTPLTPRCPHAGQAVPSGPVAFHQNQFGVVVTGPIIKNKTFFSGSYDGWRYSQPGQALSYVPSAAEVNGDFTNTPFSRPIYNPYSTVGSTRQQFRCDAAGNPLPVNAQNLQDQTIGTPCRKIPQALIYAPMQQFFQTYSAAPNLFNPLIPNSNYIQNRPTINNSDGFQVRIDHHFRPADQVFFRFTQEKVTVNSPIGDAGSTSGSSAGRNYGGGWTHIFGNNLLLDVRAGYAGRPGVDSSQQNQHEAGTAPLATAGFKDIDKYAGLLVRLQDWTAGGSNDFGIRGPAIRQNPNWSVTPNLSWLHGRHNIKTGFWFIEAKSIQLNTYQRYLFDNEQTRLPSGSSGTTGLSLASALLGFPNSFAAELPVPHGDPVKFKYGSWAAYLQDEWKLTMNVTLTLGLRYDYVTQPETLDGRLWNALDLKNKRWIIGATRLPGLCSAVNAAPCIPDAEANDPLFKNNVVVAGKRFFAPPPIKDNWGPRIGLAWAITPKTVMRTGWGLYWDSLPARSQYAQNDLEMGIWPDATAFSGNVNATANFSGGTAQNIIAIQSQGLPTPLPTTAPGNSTTRYINAAIGCPSPGCFVWTPANTFADDPRYKDGYSMQWHFELQRELSPSTAITAAYVGSKNGRLPYSGLGNAASQAFPNGTPAATIDAVRPIPWLGANINYTRAIGWSHYNALETKLQRRFTNGLQSLISYTFGKSTDVGSGYFNVENGPGGGSSIQNYYDPNTARGVSSYDITHFLSWATLYELPFGRGKKWFQSGPGAWFLGDWQANYIFQVRSGQPYNLQVTGDLANLRGGAPAAPGTYLRPNLLADPFVPGLVAANPDPNCQKTISQGGRAADQVHVPQSWFNPCAFGIPVGGFGNLPRNAFRGPHVVNMDFSMFKGFRLAEQKELQLRFEAFNIFNIQNYDVPSSLTINTNATSIASGAGRVTALAQGTTPRQLQFGIRFNF
jgi:hypothetical protein